MPALVFRFLIGIAMIVATWDLGRRHLDARRGPDADREVERRLRALEECLDRRADEHSAAYQRPIPIACDRPVVECFECLRL